MENFFRSALTVRVSLFLLLLVPLAAFSRVTVTEGTNLSVDVTSDGRIVFDLLGGLWILPPKSSKATPVKTGLAGVRQPRWSADASRIAFTATSNGTPQIWVLEVATSRLTRISDGTAADVDADWHPDSGRIVFSSTTRDGTDLWEIDLETGLRWRLTDLPGAERDPAWSANGRDLVFVHEHEGRWSLVMRRFGEPDRILLESGYQLASPSWRPDGSLISYLQFEDEVHIHMLILSDPSLDRELVTDDDVFDSPIAWADRDTLYYAANGSIRRRDFNSWIPRDVPFRASVGSAPGKKRTTAQRRLPQGEAPDKRWILRVDRLYAGGDADIEDSVDILIDGGRIASVEAQSDREDDLVVDMGDVTAIPGLIDAYAALPPTADSQLGPLLLSLGVTTMVVPRAEWQRLAAEWQGETMPGPRLLPFEPVDALSDDPLPWLATVASNASLKAAATARKQGIPLLADDWQTGLASGAGLVLGIQGAPHSPAGRRYADTELANGNGAINVISALADASTPGLEALLSLRQSRLMDARITVRPAGSGGNAAVPDNVVIGSLPNGLPPGLATHAELKALSAAGKSPRDVLKAAGSRAAQTLGIGRAAGQIRTGYAADIVLVAGNPLDDTDAIPRVVAVVRNGRFFSAVGLIDRAR